MQIEGEPHQAQLLFKKSLKSTGSARGAKPGNGGMPPNSEMGIQLTQEASNGYRLKNVRAEFLGYLDRLAKSSLRLFDI